MHFRILLGHASMNFLKDFSGMSLGYIVMTLEMASTPSKPVPLMIPLILKEKIKVTRSSHHTLSLLSARHGLPFLWKSSFPGVIFHLLTSLVELFYHSKTCVHVCYHNTLAEVFQGLVTEFSKNFRFIYSSTLLAERSEKKV